MCGILTFASESDFQNIVPSLLQALGTLDHRGPDNKSFWSSNNIFLGHTRLSIIGLETSSNQPFMFENLVMVYNGEIFNYVELREDLKSFGYTFETTSDTEVVLKAFQYYGTDCFNLFNGMWALAIYDIETSGLVICRDRFGQKPLFYSMVNDKLVFASELHTLTEIDSYNPNYRAIKSFLQEGSFDVGGETFFEGVYEFPNASYMRCLGGKIIECSRYWVYPEKSNHEPLSDDIFHSLLNDSIEIRLRTDVDYCLLLSAGIDSTIVAGVMHELVGDNNRISAFTYSSKDEDDEVTYAKVVAKELNIDLNICSTPLDASEYLSVLRKMVKLLGRGHSSPAIVSSYALYKSVSEHGYKVALDGQGADELLAGYKHYHFHLILDLLRRGQFSQIYWTLKDLIHEGVKDVSIMVLRNTLPDLGRRYLRKIYGYEYIFNAEYGNEKYKSPYLLNLPAPKSYGSFDKYLHKQHTSGLGNLLYYGDITAMANSVENRSPFMDHRIVELAFKEGTNYKVRFLKNKAVLRSHPVYLNFEHVLNRKKIGFNSPIDNETRKRMIRELQKSNIINWPIFIPEKFREILDDGRLEKKKYERFLFRLIQVHLWADQFSNNNA